MVLIAMHVRIDHANLAVPIMIEYQDTPLNDLVVLIMTDHINHTSHW